MLSADYMIALSQGVDVYGTKDAIKAVERLQARVKALEDFAKDLAENYDHDQDAHKYGTSCRVCDANELLN